MTPNQKQYLSIVAAIVILTGAYAFGKVYLKKPLPQNSDSEQTTSPQPSPSPGEGETSGWETYRNEELGFEVKYLAEWRTKFNKTSSFFNRIAGIKIAQATPEFEQELMDYAGNRLLNVWFQNPELDMKPVLEKQYADEPQYFQYSNYNGAPQGIFVYVFEKAEYSSGPRKETRIGGQMAYRITYGAPSEFPAVWATEKVEVKKAEMLFVIFYAGEGYSTAFDQILSTFKFLK